MSVLPGMTGLPGLIGFAAAGDLTYVFNPESLFANGEVGMTLLPGTEYTTLFQERTGASATTVAGVGDPVGTVRCNITGRYAVAAGDDGRPTLIDDGGYLALQFSSATSLALITASNIDWSVTDEQSTFFKVRKTSDATQGLPVNFNSGTSLYSFSLRAPAGTDLTNARWFCRGSGSSQTVQITGLTSPITLLGYGINKLSTDYWDFKINEESVNPTSTLGGEAFESGPLAFGGRATGGEVFNGLIYGIIVRGKLPANNDERDAVEAYLAESSAFFSVSGGWDDAAAWDDSKTWETLS